MKNNIKKSVPNQKGRARIQHAFRNIREPICVDARNNSVLSLTVPASSTTATAFVTFTPLGLACPALTVNGSNVVVGSATDILGPSMRWLYNTAQNFGKYRVTRASVVFVGSVGTIFTGQLIMTGFKDVLDALNIPQVAYATGPNAKVFDIASSGSKELRLSIPVDSSWKKVSKLLGVTGTTTPFLGFNNQLISVNSANDLAFGAFTAQVVGAPNASSPNYVGSFFLDYDVEFGDPESNSLNV